MTKHRETIEEINAQIEAQIGINLAQSRFYAPKIENLFNQVGERLKVRFKVAQDTEEMGGNHDIHGFYWLPNELQQAVHLLSGSSQWGICDHSTFRVAGRIMNTQYLHSLTEEELKNFTLSTIFRGSPLLLRYPAEMVLLVKPAGGVRHNGMFYSGLHTGIPYTTVRFLPSLSGEKFGVGEEEGIVIELNADNLLEKILNDVPELGRK